MRHRAVFALVVSAMTLPAIGVCAGTVDDATLARLAHAYADARAEDSEVRRFVGLFLRVAGAAWIAIEWVAAVYLIRGYRLLSRWFEVAPR